MLLWLDDVRDPETHGAHGFVWAKTANEAIRLLKTGTVTFASLDHDLTDEQMIRGGYQQRIHDDGCRSGYDVVCWLEENPQYLPKDGTTVHSANPAGKKRMMQVLDRLYGCTV